LVRLEGLPGERIVVRHRPSGLRQGGSCLNRFSPSTKAPPARTMKTSASIELSRPDRRDLAEGARRDADIYTFAAAYAERGILLPTIRIRHGRRRHAVRDGRDADAGFVALLAGRPVRAGISPPSYDKQFVRDYLETSTGTSRRRARSCPG
jgi:phosphoribosylaminoimidazole-succinocarboxamide synthase